MDFNFTALEIGESVPSIFSTLNCVANYLMSYSICHCKLMSRCCLVHCEFDSINEEHMHFMGIISRVITKSFTSNIDRLFVFSCTY